MGLARVQRYLKRQNITLWLSNIPAANKNLVFNALNQEQDTSLYYATADQALEAAENALLHNWNNDTDNTSGLAILLSQAELTAEEVKIVDAHLQLRKFKSGDYITRTGRNENSFYIVDQGQVAIQQIRGDEKIRLRVLKPGMVVGEMAIYSGKARSADAIAEGDTTVFEFTGKQLAQLEKQHSHIALKIHRILANSVAAMLIDEAHLQRVRN